MDSADAELGRLRWRCRRGMKELDLLLGGYLEDHFGDAPADEQAAFRTLLDIADPELYAYCLGHEAPPSRFALLLQRITAGFAA